MKIAEDHGVVLAIENHIDYTSEEIHQILERVGSDALKVNFDTGNTLRMMEDPVAAARRLGPYTVATHTKDVDACRHVRPEEWYFFSSVPVGTGLIDMPGVVPGTEGERLRGRAGRRVGPPQGQPGRGQAGRREHRLFEEAGCRAVRRGSIFRSWGIHRLGHVAGLLVFGRRALVPLPRRRGDCTSDRA